MPLSNVSKESLRLGCNLCNNQLLGRRAHLQPCALQSKFILHLICACKLHQITFIANFAKVLCLSERRRDVVNRWLHRRPYQQEKHNWYPSKTVSNVFHNVTTL